MSTTTRRTAAMALAAAAALLAGCSDDSILLGATPAQPRADGETMVEVSAQVTTLGLAADDGTTVWFRASEPLLFADPEAGQPAVPGGLVTGDRELEAPVHGGVASAFVRAPVAEAAIDIDARFDNEDGTSIAASTQIVFAPPRPVSSGTQVSGELAAPQFSFACDADRVGAFVDDRPDILVGCTLVTRAHDDSLLYHAPVMLFAEAGKLIEAPATESTARQFYYRVPALLERRPADVAPLAGEMDYATDGGDLIPGASEANPRDGLVTLLAVVRGQEAYMDTNGNGTWDEGEPFLDEGEPFLDVDDDGTWDPDIDGPLCCDTNGNGKVDGPNGVWDGDAWIGRTAHVMWTGPVAIGPGRSELTPVDAQIDAGSSADLAMTIVDANFNPVAFNGTDDQLVISAVGPIDLAPLPGLELSSNLGFPVTDRFPQFRFAGPSVAADAEVPVDGVRRWLLTVMDQRTNQTCGVDDWSLFVDVFASPAAGDDMPTTRANLSVDGTLGPCSGVP